MKKVLFTIGSLTGGGAERVVSIWSSILAQRGYSVAVYIAYRCDEEYGVDEKVRVIATADNKQKYLSIPKLKRMIHKRQFIKQWKPDVIISFLPGTQIRTMFASIGVKARRIETVRIDPWQSKKRTKGACLWLHCLNKSDAIILQTNDQRDFFSLKNQKKCVVVRNPISKTYVDAERKEYSEEVKKFIAAGRICEQKNYPMMIKAFASVANDFPNISLDIYGAGADSYVKVLDNLIQECGMSNRILLKGRTNDMCSALMTADAYLMSSDFEGMPNTLAEAMATGLPCISTDCRTGPRDMIDDGNSGYLCAVRDSADMESKIRMLIGMSKEERTKMGISARKSIIELCDEEKNISKLIEVIEG